MAISVSDICENTKLAREMSLLGNYETATVYYQGVVQQIHRCAVFVDRDCGHFIPVCLQAAWNY